MIRTEVNYMAQNDPVLIFHQVRSHRCLNNRKNIKKTGILPPFICGNKLDIKWISANMPEVRTDRADIMWHGEKAMTVHFNDVMNQYIHLACFFLLGPENVNYQSLINI